MRTYSEIMDIVKDACRQHLPNSGRDNSKEIIEATTKIYIEELRHRQRTDRPDVYAILR